MAGSSVGRSIVLLLLVLIVAAAGLIWFDYLNVIDVKTTLAPVYRLFGIQGRTQPVTDKDDFINLDAERLAVRLESLDLQEMELKKQEDAIKSASGDIEQKAAELETRQKSLDEREQALNSLAESGDVRERNIEQNARYLNSMPPANAVAIIAAMEDQQAIDVLRKTEEIAKAEGTASIVSVWLSQLPPARAADLQRKMNERPF